MDKLEFFSVMKENKHIIFAITALLVIIFSVVLIISLLSENSEDGEEAFFPLVEDMVAGAINNSIDYYRKEVPVLTSWWEIVALKGTGINFAEENWDMEKWKSLEVPPGSSANEYAGMIFLLTALNNGDALPVADLNPVHDLKDLQDDEGGFGGGINNTIWAVIALNTANADFFDDEMRTKAMNYLFREQNEDGGFSYSGDAGDADMTAMALQALATSRHIPGVDDVIEKALSFLKEHYAEEKAFLSYGQENSNSLAVVISALISVGEDPTADYWNSNDEGSSNLREGKVGEEYGLLSLLLEYQNSDGSFAFLPQNNTADNMATYQSLIALGDIDAGETVFQRLKLPEEFSLKGNLDNDLENLTDDDVKEDESPRDNDYDGEGNESDSTVNGSIPSGLPGGSGTTERDSVHNNTPPPSPSREEERTGINEPREDDNVTTYNVNLKVVGEKKTYFDGIISLNKDKNYNPINILSVSGLSFKVLYGGVYVAEIMGEKENISIGSGWKYKINGIIPGSPATEHIVKEGDLIIWWFADNPNSTGP